MNATIAIIKTTIVPPINSMRGFALAEKAMNTMMPSDPNIGTTIAKMLPGPAPSTTSGGGWIVMVPFGSLGRSTLPDRGVGTRTPGS